MRLLTLLQLRLGLRLATNALERLNRLDDWPAPACPQPVREGEAS